MEIVAYYEGADDVKHWLDLLLHGNTIIYKKIPINSSKEFTELPAYIADILYLDKPDVILAGRIDGIHEKPLFSIEFASCTPQYQHALQRFSRMMASVAAGCPSLIIMARQKAENSGGGTIYQRSRALEYGAVKLMDAYRIPAFVFDWPEVEGVLQNEPNTGLPILNAASILSLKNLLQQSFIAFNNNDYISALWKLPDVIALIDKMRNQAYYGGAPTIDRPGGGGVAASQASLKLWDTNVLLSDIRSTRAGAARFLAAIPDFIERRSQSLVFNPTRIVKHAGDPYVGMIGYYDIAFCRNGPSSRDRVYNLVAYCNGLSINEVEMAMGGFVQRICPFTKSITPTNVLQYSYNLKHGCRETKIKPIRIYSELADMVVFDDGIIFNVG